MMCHNIGHSNVEYPYYSALLPSVLLPPVLSFSQKSFLPTFPASSKFLLQPSESHKHFCITVVEFLWFPLIRKVS